MSDWMPGVRHHDMSGRRGNGRFNRLHPMLGVILHVNDAYPGTPPGWFIAGGGADEVCPNFQVLLDGTIWQFLPGNWRPWCQRNGNDSYVAIETAGLHSQPLTDRQQRAVVRILAWLHREHGLALKVAQRPGERGLGTHKMGGQAWGGHDCPGLIRSHQRSVLIQAAKDTIAGTAHRPRPSHAKAAAHVLAESKPLTDRQLMHELNLDAHQLTNERGIITAARAHPKFKASPHRAAVIATETAITESGIRMLASANVPASQRYPHDRLSWTSDGLGHDHASCGMYQQQTGWRYALPGTSTMGSPVGWGTPRQLMNPVFGTTAFLDALARVRWRTLERWRAAQAVQRSAFADGSNYRRSDGRAQRIVDALWSNETQPATTSKPAKPSASTKAAATHARYLTVTVRYGDTLAGIAADHDTSWRALARLNRLPNPNRIAVGQRLRVPA